METILVQVNNNKAYKLLEDLQDLNLITLVKNNPAQAQTFSEKYAGKLPTHIAHELQDYVTQSRNEWNNSI